MSCPRTTLRPGPPTLLPSPMPATTCFSSVRPMTTSLLHHRHSTSGITCGLSAPYVAGQIAHSMAQANHVTVLVGFNPVALARNVPIEKWHRTCAEVGSRCDVRRCVSEEQVFTDLAEQQARHTQRHFVLNPIVGPEPVTGSSRMKGGSATLILLMATFYAGSTLKTRPHMALISMQACAAPLVDLQWTYRPCCSSTRTLTAVCTGWLRPHNLQRPSPVSRHIDELSALVAAAGTCLQSPTGHLYYLGSGPYGMMG